MNATNFNEQNFFLQMNVQRLEQENADLKTEIFKMLMAWGTAQDELKTLREELERLKC